MYKKYYFEKKIEAPELRGPGACAPPAPWLIRHWQPAPPHQLGFAKAL